ncbi:hypothetical protein AeRB84_005710 [Aphanomyces euteiches]|nr:hypothetical protein AeRB84_005710 [Aphanomyces euteiches]
MKMSKATKKLDMYDNSKTRSNSTCINGAISGPAHSSVKRMKQSRISDSMESAREDSLMHILSLCMLYALGMRENTSKGEVSTPGGPFPQGPILIDKLRSLAAFFEAPQRSHKLDKVKTEFRLPNIRAHVDAPTRIGFVSSLLSSSLLNEYAYKMYFETYPDDKVDVFRSISSDDWELAAELEGIMNALAAFNLGEVQTEKVSASFSFLLLHEATSVVRASAVNCFTRVRPEKSSNVANWPRRAVDVDSLSSHALCCLRRLNHQVDIRLPKPSMNQHKAMLLDPRVKSIVVPEYSSDRDEAIEQLLVEHRSVYARLALKQGPTTPPATTMAGELDAGDEAICDDVDEFAVPRPRENFNPPSTSLFLLELEADEVWRKWAAFEVSWERYTTADVVKTGSHGCMYDVWKLYKEIDVLAWYRDVGVTAFPSIAILARTYLAKPMSNAFQERFFSTAGHVVNTKRTRLDSSRAEKLQILMHANK